jgi:hypothetical protein
MAWYRHYNIRQDLSKARDDLGTRWKYSNILEG